MRNPGIAPRGLRPSRTRESLSIPGSSERVDGLSWAYATDYSRYARAGSAVFDLRGAPPSRHASLASGDPKVAGRNRTARTSTEPNARIFTDTRVIRARRWAVPGVRHRLLTLRASWIGRLRLPLRASVAPCLSRLRGAKKCLSSYSV